MCRALREVADFMSHTGSQECERLDAFALDHFKFLLLLSGVINDHRQARAPSPTKAAVYTRRKRLMG